MNLFAIGVGESVRVYQDKLKGIFENNKTITLHQGLHKIYQHYGLLPDYYTWGDPFASLHSLRFLNSLDHPIQTEILILSTQTGSFSEFRKYHGTSNAKNHWSEYLELIEILKSKGIKVTTIPTRTTKEKFPTLEERFSKENIWFGTTPYGGDASEARSSAETKLTSLVFPLAHYLGLDTVKVLGFDCIGGRFYDPIDGVPQSPFSSREIPMLIENMDIWESWKHKHNLELISVVEDKYTVNNKAIKYEKLK